MVRDRVQSPVEIIEAPHDGAVSESTRFKKVGIVAGGGFMACHLLDGADYLSAVARYPRARQPMPVTPLSPPGQWRGPPEHADTWSRKLCDHVTSSAASSMVVGSDPQAAAQTAYQLALASAAGGLRTLLVSSLGARDDIDGRLRRALMSWMSWPDRRARDAVCTVANDLAWLPLLLANTALRIWQHSSPAALSRPYGTTCNNIPMF